ncbi:integrase core domain-containing protein, partial [Burkholderia cepacia]|uniref:integrase core domain-containing protein n=1 Tax=Burkholderia cepacia TaxID=292 RepID=UPI0026516A22
QASCGGSPWFPVREVGPGNPILSDSTGEPPPSTFNYAWDIARLKEMRGLPASITVDNGPEFAGKVLDAWAYEAGVTLSFIRPGKPVENAYIESFNGRFRDECLNEHWFVSMRHAKRLIEEWRIEYNTERPHSSLGYLTPVQFARAHDAKQQFLTSDSNCSPD